jgi:drug/metabolite transporter (DMT)-like permease
VAGDIESRPKPPTPAGRPAGVRLFADRRLTEIAVVAVMVFWAANFIVVKGIIDVLPPVGFTFLRYFLASVALLAILRLSEGEIRLPRPGAGRILLLGGLGFGLYQMLWTVGLQSIPAGDSALLIAASPVLTAIIAVVIGTDTLNPRKAVGVVLSFAGVVLVIAAGVGIELTGSPMGFALTMAAALCWATYTAFGAKVLRRHSPLVLTTWATIGGTLVLAPVGIGQLLAPGALGAEQAAALPSIVFAIAFSGLLAAALANVVVFQGVGLLGPTRIMTLQSLVPAMAVVLAFLFLHEPIRPVQILGGGIIILGVALTRLASRRPVAARS